MFTLLYLCFPLFTRVYLCLLFFMFTPVYSSLPMIRASPSMLSLAASTLGGWYPPLPVDYHTSDWWSSLWKSDDHLSVSSFLSVQQPTSCSTIFASILADIRFRKDHVIYLRYLWSCYPSLGNNLAITGDRKGLRSVLTSTKLHIFLTCVSAHVIQ